MLGEADVLTPGQEVTPEIVKRVQAMDADDVLAEITLILVMCNVADEDLEAYKRQLEVFYKHPDRYQKVPDGKALKRRPLPKVEE